MAKVIGRFFAETLQAAKSNSYPFYNSVPSSQMGLEELQQLKTKLEELIVFWLGQVPANTAWEAQANAQAIADLLQTRLDDTAVFINQKSGVVQTATGEQVPQLETDATPTEAKKSWLPIIAIAAVALYFFTKKKRTA